MKEMNQWNMSNVIIKSLDSFDWSIMHIGSKVIEITDYTDRKFRITIEEIV